MRYCLSILFTLSSVVSLAQNERFVFGFFPEAALSYKLSEHYTTTHKIESQHGLYDTQYLNQEFEYAHQLTDVQTFLGRRLSPFLKADIGYQYRLQEGENTHRTIQQISILQRASYYRLGHRVRVDQTFYKDAPLLFRARYRLKGQLPLQGQSLDVGETYLAISNEVIYMIQRSEDDIENRFAAALGFYMDDKNKFEVGFDYRTDDYLVENRFRHRLWFKVGYYKSL